jgi:hypothetical protein
VPRRCVAGAFPSLRRPDRRQRALRSRPLDALALQRLCHGYPDPRPTGPTISLAYRSSYTHDGSGMRSFGVSERSCSRRCRCRAAPPPSRCGIWHRQLGSACTRARMDSRRRQAGRSSPSRSGTGCPTTRGTVDALHLAQYDVITLNHVIEHVHEPRDVLRTCCRALRRGGSVWLTAPNVDRLGHRVLHTDWYGLDTPRHLTIFSDPGLGAARRAAGFARLEWRPSVGCARRARGASRGALPAARRTSAAERPSRRPGSGPAFCGRADATPDRPSSRDPRGAQATELLVPRTADELLVRAWPE